MTAMMEAVRGEYKGTGRTHKEEAGGNGSGLPFGLIIFLLIVIFIIIMSNRGRRRKARLWLHRLGRALHRRIWRKRRSWSGGGSSGGGGFSGFSGGGGGFGGGGAGSGW